MFRAIVLPIIRSIRPYNAACVMKTPNELLAGGLVSCQTTGQLALYGLMLLMMGKTTVRNT